MTTPSEGSQPPAGPPPAYHAYLLRFWAERGAQPEATVWRFSLEDPHTTQRHGFASLEALTAWLHSQVGGEAGAEG